MCLRNIKKFKKQKVVLTSLACLLLSTSQLVASYSLGEENQRQMINAHRLPASVAGQGVKVGIIDDYFDPNSDTRDSLSKSTCLAFVGQNAHVLVEKAHKLGHDHSNHVASSIHNIAPGAELRIIDLNNEPSLQSKTDGCMRLIAAIDEAIKSKVSFLNISLRISPDGDWNGPIDQNVKEAFLRARDAGIGIIKSAGNDQEFTGHTAYTRSLVELLEAMQGHMLIATATQYDSKGQFEKLAHFGKDSKTKLLKGSNLAGLAHDFAVSAPGKYNYARGAADERIAMSGTSMAAPIVTGAAALLKSVHPELSASAVLTLLLNSARTKSLGQQYDLPAGKYGRGILDVASALRLAEECHNEKK